MTVYPPTGIGMKTAISYMITHHIKSENFYQFLLFLCCLLPFSLFSQAVDSPTDLRQHNLIRYNKSLLNPVFSFDANEGPVHATTGRIQWTDLEFPPTTYFTNFNNKFGEYNAFGIGALIHDTDIFTNIGLVVNYSRNLVVNDIVSITLGINAIAGSRIVDRNNFTLEAFNALPPDNGRDDILTTLIPGINVHIGDFSIGAASENFFDYNFSTSAQETSFSEKIFLGHLGYNYHLGASEAPFLQGGVLKAFAYLKTIPGFETQFGGNLSLDIQNAWAQFGYNNFYGPSVGVGGLFFNTLGIGFNAELGTFDDEIDLGPTYEFSIAWEFSRKEREIKPKRRGPKLKGVRKKTRKKVKAVDNKLSSKELVIADQPLATSEAGPDPFDKFYKEGGENDQYYILDNVDNVESGFYLVVNVYATEKYFNLFMKDLSDRGFDPQFFYNPIKKYYYVYLRRYDTLEAAEAAKSSNFSGRYPADKWIVWIQE